MFSIESSQGLSAESGQGLNVQPCHGFSVEHGQGFSVEPGQRFSVEPVWINIQRAMTIIMVLSVIYGDKARVKFNRERLT